MRPYEFMMRRAPPYMMTHPYSSDRVEALRQGIERSSHHERDGQRRQHSPLPDDAGQADRLHPQPGPDAGALSRDATRPRPARYARAIAYYRVNQLPNGAARTDSLIAEEPRNPYYQELMGQILFDSGRAAESIPYHRRSLELAPDQPLLPDQPRARADRRATAARGADEAVPLLQAALDARARQRASPGANWRKRATCKATSRRPSWLPRSRTSRSATIPAALSFAERARRGLPRNTPSYQRAVDLVSFSAEHVREMQRQRGGARRS